MEEGIVCYICYEPEMKDNSYLKEPPPCECKGSIVIHKECLQDILKTSRVCTICKTKYKVQYLPNRNGLELVTEVAINGDISEYTVDETGDIQGEYIVKKQSGEIISKTNYLNGLLHGEYRTWYDNGQLECHCYCFRNKIEGEYISWYDNGKIMEQTLYQNGVKNGLCKRYDKKGKLVMSRVYINGEMKPQV
jgi:antitoxin component YwqK of YwqJK toxin-antitoxin module